MDTSLPNFYYIIFDEYGGYNAVNEYYRYDCSEVIQVVAGVVVAVGAVVGIYWRKAKKKVQDKLGIDENANKEVEDEIVVSDDK